MAWSGKKLQNRRKEGERFGGIVEKESKRTEESNRQRSRNKESMTKNVEKKNKEQDKRRKRDTVQ